MKFSSRKGFTLIELLIVIAIMAILTVISLQTLKGGQAAARNVSRKMHKRYWGRYSSDRE